MYIMQRYILHILTKKYMHIIFVHMHKYFSMFLSYLFYHI